MDEHVDMRRRRKPPTEAASPLDADLHARLSRLRSELAQSKRAPEDKTSPNGRISEVERKLAEAEEMAEGRPNTRSGLADDEKGRCLLTVHEVEAELCMIKPATLLYPTWTRLRENLYRFGEGRREAWKDDIASLISADIDETSSDTLRDRLRQLTLELQESAARYNRLAEERAAVTREVVKLGLKLVCAFAVLAAASVALSTWTLPAPGATLLSLLAGIASGGMGAVFSRLRTLRNERTRREFEGILKLDMGLRACIGSSAALFVVAVLLSESLPVFRLPDESTARAALLVVVGFGAGFSDRLFNVMLSRVIGSRGPRSSRNSG